MICSKYYPGFQESFVDVGDVTIHTLTGGDSKEAILFLHGHPENYLIWRDVAPALASEYKIVLTDLRGYGESSKPVGLADHSNYSKRVMAEDQIKVMDSLGIERFHVVGHDRGARVLHRMIMDYPDRIISCTLMDILPTDDMYEQTNEQFATKYWHWFFYIQDYDFPERILGSSPEYFIRYNMQKKVSPNAAACFPEDVLEDYIRHYSDPCTLHGICEDYRASVTIDRTHNAEDSDHTIRTPLLVLWGKNGVVGQLWDVLSGWKKYAINLEGYAVPDCGHFVPEEQPEFVLEKIKVFLDKNK